MVFLSPPWGGPEYLSGEPGNGGESHPEFSLAGIQPMHGAELFALSRRVTGNVAYYLPRNTNLDEISGLVARDGLSVPEMVEVEEEWMGTKLKALTCYFGGLVRGQEEVF